MMLYAKRTDFYEDILKIKASFTPEMEKAKLDGAMKLVEQTIRIIADKNNFYNVLKGKTF